MCSCYVRYPQFVCFRSGEGVAGHDLSQSSDWADGSQSGHCAVVQDDLMWYSVKCSSRYHVYCSGGGATLHYKKKVSWHQASQLCQALMSNLATITTSNKNDLDNSGWIGLSRRARHNWSWVGNSSSKYRNWAPGEPLTTDCGSFDPKTKKWYSSVLPGAAACLLWWQPPGGGEQEQDVGAGPAALQGHDNTMCWLSRVLHLHLQDAEPAQPAGLRLCQRADLQSHNWWGWVLTR